jgi:predicted RNase H-like HicB family nuclease
MELFTTVLRKSGDCWVALCLENGLVGQGNTKKEAIDKLKEAIDSFTGAREEDPRIYTAPIKIKELHEFLTVESPDATTEKFELRAVYA